MRSNLSRSFACRWHLRESSARSEIPLRVAFFSNPTYLFTFHPHYFCISRRLVGPFFKCFYLLFVSLKKWTRKNFPHRVSLYPVCNNTASQPHTRNETRAWYVSVKSFDCFVSFRFPCSSSASMRNLFVFGKLQKQIFCLAHKHLCSKFQGVNLISLPLRLSSILHSRRR